LQEQPPKGEIDCLLCTTIIQFAESELNSSSTQTDVENFLENVVCSFFPSSYQFYCETFIYLNYPSLLQYILTQETPAVACIRMGACTNSTSTTPVKEIEVPKPVAQQPQKEGEGFGCTICTLLVNLGESYLAENSTENEVENFLENTACTLLPTILSYECDAIVVSYLPALVQSILSKNNGTVECTRIGLCAGSVAKPLMKLRPVKPVVQVSEPKAKESIDCTICILVINLTESYVGSNATQSAIEQFLDNTVCSLLPSLLSYACDYYVQSNIQQLVQKIKSGENGQIACTQMGTCPGSIVEKK